MSKILKKISSGNIEALLSTLWIFVLLNIIFRDIHQLFAPGFLEEMLSGVVNGNQITDGLLLVGGISVELSLVMVVLSRVLKYEINRWTNIIIGTIAIVFAVVWNLQPDLDDMFFMAIVITTLLAIIWIAWKWRKDE